MRPNAATARSVRTATASSSSMDPTTPTAANPSARNVASVEATRSSSRPLMTTDAPSRARRKAQDRPMLGSAVEPVTTATWPENRCAPPTKAASVRVVRSAGPMRSSCPTTPSVCRCSPQRSPGGGGQRHQWCARRASSGATRSTDRRGPPASCGRSRASPCWAARSFGHDGARGGRTPTPASRRPSPGPRVRSGPGSAAPPRRGPGWTRTPGRERGPPPGRPPVSR